MVLNSQLASTSTGVLLVAVPPLVAAHGAQHFAWLRPRLLRARLAVGGGGVAASSRRQ